VRVLASFSFFSIRGWGTQECLQAFSLLLCASSGVAEKKTEDINVRVRQENFNG